MLVPEVLYFYLEMNTDKKQDFEDCLKEIVTKFG